MNWHHVLSNPWAIAIGSGVAVLFVGWLGEKFWKGSRKQDGQLSVNQNAAPVINVPVTINNSLDAQSARTARHQERETQNTLGKAKSPNRPHFEYKGPREKEVYIDRFARSGITDPRNAKERAKAIRALVFRFENVPHDGTAKYATDVIAKISFRSVNGIKEQAIDYGVWLNSTGNCTDMGPGDTRELVVISDVDGELSGFGDRRELGHEFYDEWSWLDVRNVEGLENVVIRLIEQRTGTMQTFTFHVGREGGRFNVSQAS